MWTIFFAVIFSLSVFPCFAQDRDVANVIGRATNLAGDVAEGVEVKFFALEGISGNSKSETIVKTATTDKEGKYKIVGIPAGQYRVEFNATFGSTEVWRFYLWRGARRTLDIGLPVGYLHLFEEITLRGRLLDNRNNKIQDATVTLVNAFNPNESQQGRTDQDGKFKFTLIQPGRYIVYATKPGWGATSVAADLANRSKTELNLTLKSSDKKSLLY